MNITRRQFLRSTGLAAAYLTLPAWLSACQRGDAGGKFALDRRESGLAVENLCGHVGPSQCAKWRALAER